MAEVGIPWGRIGVPRVLPDAEAVRLPGWRRGVGRAKTGRAEVKGGLKPTTSTWFPAVGSPEAPSAESLSG